MPNEGRAVLVVERLSDMTQYVGKKIGTSDWLQIDQERIDAFAETTGDDHWIHVDVERARREMPGGKTIAHGFMTLSLIPYLARSIYRIARRGRGINYGCNRVRFTGPVPVGSRIRLHQTIKAVEPLEGAVRITTECQVEIEGQERPALVADTIVQIYEP
jgi:acyl dehydratase